MNRNNECIFSKLRTTNYRTFHDNSTCADAFSSSVTDRTINSQIHHKFPRTLILRSCIAFTHKFIDGKITISVLDRNTVEKLHYYQYWTTFSPLIINIIINKLSNGSIWKTDAKKSPNIWIQPFSHPEISINVQYNLISEHPKQKLTTLYSAWHMLHDTWQTLI